MSGDLDILLWPENNMEDIHVWQHVSGREGGVGSQV